MQPPKGARIGGGREGTWQEPAHAGGAGGAFAALAIRTVAAAGAAKARLHLKIVVPDNHDGREPRHDECVVDEDHESGEDAEVL